MSKTFQSWIGWQLVLVFFCAVLILPVTEAQAWRGRTKLSQSSAKIKDLSKANRKKICNAVVAGLMRDEKIKEAELSLKVALAQTYFEGAALGGTQREFTDLVLNKILSYSKMVVLNQDMRIDLSLKYQLMDYTSALETRKKGILLGANYYIQSYLKSKPVTRESGKVEYQYTAAISLRDIRTNELVAKSLYDEDSKRRNRKKRYRGGL